MAEATLQPKVKETVTVIDAPKAVDAAPLPSREELKAKENWSDKELDAAEKRGMIAKPGEEKKPETAADAAPKADEKPAAAAEAKAEDKKPEEKAPPAPRGTLPDFQMTPEQEKVFLATFGPGTQPRGMYFRMKNERHSRQAAEALARELKAKIEVYEKGGLRPAEDLAVEDDDKPLTLKALREQQQKEADRIAIERQAQQERTQHLTTAQTEQEEYAKTLYPDFDAAVNLANDVISNLDALIPEKHKQAKVVQMIRQLQYAAANADRIGMDEYHAAHIAYEIGQLHPEYGKTVKSPEPAAKDTKANGGLSAEQLKRIEQNSERRASSASVASASGSRTVAPEDVTEADLAGMDWRKRTAFKTKYPEQYKKILNS